MWLACAHMSLCEHNNTCIYLQTCVHACTTNVFVCVCVSTRILYIQSSIDSFVCVCWFFRSFNYAFVYVHNWIITCMLLWSLMCTIADTQAYTHTCVCVCAQQCAHTRIFICAHTKQFPVRDPLGKRGGTIGKRGGPLGKRGDHLGSGQTTLGSGENSFKNCIVCLFLMFAVVCLSPM